MRILGRSPVSTNRSPAAPRRHRDPVLESIKAGIESGRPFQISVLRYGKDTMHLNIPMTVVATKGSDGLFISNDDLGLYGHGKTIRAAYKDFSGCVMSAYELFGQEDDRVASEIRRHVES